MIIRDAKFFLSNLTKIEDYLNELEKKEKKEKKKNKKEFREDVQKKVVNG